MPQVVPIKAQKPWYLLIGFFILVATSVIISWFFFRYQKQDFREQRVTELSAIADLKVKQISEWRRERLSDATFFFNNTRFIRQVAKFIGAPRDNDQLNQVLTEMQAMFANGNYRHMVLWSPRAQEILSVHSHSVHSISESYFDSALSSRRIVFSDFFRDDSARIKIDIYVPLLNKGNSDTTVIALLMLEIDPYDKLYDLIQSWTTPSPTAEVLVVRQDENDILFLNELRHRQQTALNLRIPVTDESLPAARAARGFTDTREGLDYRGVPVLAATRHIPNSPWFLVAKIDQSEIYASLISRTRTQMAIIFLALMVVGLWLMSYWLRIVKDNQIAIYKQELERRALARHYDFLARYANDIILLFNADLKITEANERAVEVYGYTREELLGMAVQFLRPAHLRDEVLQVIEKVNQEEGYLYQTVHQNKSGTTFDVEINTRKIVVEGQVYYQSIVRDITERILAQEALRRSEERLAQIIEIVPEGITTVDCQGQITYANLTAQQILGLQSSAIAGRTYNDPQWKITALDGGPFPEEELPFRRVMQSGAPVYGVEHAIEHPDGQRVILTINAAPLKDTTGNLTGMVAAISNITQRKQAEKKILTLNRTYAVLSNINQLIVRSTDWQSLFEESCRIAINDGHFKMAWIGLVDEHQQVIVAASAGETQDYLENLNINLHDQQTGSGPTGRAIKTGHYQVCNDISQDARMAAWRERAQRYGYRSSAAFPLKLAGNPIGTFNFYAADVDVFDDDEIKLLDELANDLSYAMEHITIETQRKKAELELHQKSEELEQFFNTNLELLAIADTEGFIRRLNREWEKTLGYQLSELEGQRFLDFVHPDDQPATLSAVATLSRQKEILNFINRYRRKDGSYRWIEWRSATVGQHIYASGRDITERKQVEEAQRESEAFIKAVMDNLPIGVAVNSVAPEVQFTYMNDNFPRFYHTTREALVHPDTFWEAVYEEPVFRAQIRKRVLDDCATGDLQRMQWDDIPITREGKEIAFISARNVPIPGKNLIISTVWDVTVRKLAEQKLIESEQRYRALFENMNAGFVLFEVVQDEQGLPADLIIVAANAVFAATTGLKIEEAIGKRLTKVLPGIEKDAADWIGRYGKVALTSESTEFEQKSELLGIHYSVAAFHSGPKLCAVTFVDITERKRAEEKLRLLAQVAQELSTAHKLEDITAMVLRAARALVGSDGATFVLKEENYCHYVDEDGISPLWKGKRFPLDTCISGRAILDRQSVAIADLYADESVPHAVYRPTFVKSLVMVPVRASDPIAVIGNYWAQPHQATAVEIHTLQTLADATSVAMENVRIIQELEDRVRDRTAQLEMVNKELEAFSYSVSHDLRAPLRAIDGFSKMILEDYQAVLDAEGIRLFNVIRTNIQKMSQLITDLLEFSRTSRADLKVSPVSISELFRELIDDVKRTESNRRFRFTLKALPDTAGDIALLKLVAQNLLGNAVKFTRPKKIASITIGSRSEPERIIYYVRDNGVGFDMRYADKLFGVFQRLHRDDEFEGTGLGLALVQRIIHKHGGEVWAESRLNKGTTLFFSLPRRE